MGRVDQTASSWGILRATPKKRIDQIQEGMPDATKLLKFRHLLERYDQTSLEVSIAQATGVSKRAPCPVVIMPRAKKKKSKK